MFQDLSLVIAGRVNKGSNLRKQFGAGKDGKMKKWVGDETWLEG